MDQSSPAQATAEPETAGRHLVAHVPAARPDDTTAKVLAIVNAAPRQWDSLTYIYICDDERRPVGVVSIEQLHAAESAAKMADLMRRDVPTVRDDADQEEAAVLAIRTELDAVPVVDSAGHFLGAIDHDAILHILRREHIEDTLRRSGIGSDQRVVNVLAVRVTDLIRLRLPWLLLGLVGGMLATIVVNLFEKTLEQQLALAFFIPVIVYMSDAVGTQTETIFIRNLALERLDVGRYMLREAAVGVALGAVCAALMAVFAVAVFRSPEVALVVGLAMLVSIFAATFIAVAIPWAFNRFGKDPAFGSGPFATIVQDLLSLTVYFIIATLILLR